MTDVSREEFDELKAAHERLQDGCAAMYKANGELAAVTHALFEAFKIIADSHQQKEAIHKAFGLKLDQERARTTAEDFLHTLGVPVVSQQTPAPPQDP